MKIRPSQLWTVNGEIGRGEYVIWGGVLFALKGYLDRYLFRDVLQANWDWLDYLRWNFPSPSLVSPEALSAQGWPLLLAALPFLGAGVGLTVQRLRAARLPLWLAALFVVPVLKWFLFLVAAAAPRREAALAHTAVVAEPGFFTRLCPRSRSGSALAGMGIAALLTICVTAVGAG